MHLSVVSKSFMVKDHLGENADSKLLPQILIFDRLGWGSGICTGTENPQVILKWRSKEHSLKNCDLESIWGESEGDRRG